ncbi:MAG: zinc-dependent peptidase [Marinicaulis sp.]|nr:zinc-dependent peptidase [Marinicaulis sp.]
MSGVLYLAALAVVGLAFGAFYWRRRQRVAMLLATPLSDGLRRILKKSMPVFNRLPTEERSRLEGLINRFLSEVKFFGGGDFEVTEEMRVLIAAQACLLIVNQPDRWYKTLETIIVYPSAFKARERTYDGALELEHDSVRAGESWGRGPVVLSWDHAAYGAFIDHDGQNVVLHEFAHQLDDLTGSTDGSPPLARDHRVSDWARAFRASYERLREDAGAGRETFLDPYGATNPAEFFAVATETFFEKPDAMKREEPAVHAELVRYFRLDPAQWR